MAHKNRFKAGVIQEGRDGDCRDAEVDESDVQQLEGSHVADKVHHRREGKQIVEDFSRSKVAIIGHNIDLKMILFSIINPFRHKNA